jgi:hypothetical protein
MIGPQVMDRVPVLGRWEWLIERWLEEDPASRESSVTPHNEFGGAAGKNTGASEPEGRRFW